MNFLKCPQIDIDSMFAISTPLHMTVEIDKMVLKCTQNLSRLKISRDTFEENEVNHFYCYYFKVNILY